MNTKLRLDKFWAKDKLGMGDDTKKDELDTSDNDETMLGKDLPLYVLEVIRDHFGLHLSDDEDILYDDIKNEGEYIALYDRLDEKDFWIELGQDYLDGVGGDHAEFDDSGGLGRHRGLLRHLQLA